MKPTLELLVPDALVPDDFAPEVLRDLALPHLAMLASHALESDESVPINDHLTTWQSWFMRGQTEQNLAGLWAHALGRPATPGQRLWKIEPAHFIVARDHLELADPLQIEIRDDQARALGEVARELLAGAGWRLDVSDARQWFLQLDEEKTLEASAIECAIGRDLEPWLPQGDEELVRTWSRLSNEIQMTWFVHPVNQRRAEKDLPLINMPWLSGNGGAFTRQPLYDQITSSLGLLTARLGDKGATRDLETYDHLIAPHRIGDWSHWRNAIQGLDIRAGVLIEALKSAERTTLELVFCGETTIRHWTIKRSDLWKFWRRGSAVELFATGA